MPCFSRGGVARDALFVLDPVVLGALLFCFCLDRWLYCPVCCLLVPVAFDTRFLCLVKGLVVPS